MSKSSHLRLADLRAVHELVQECRELGDAAGVWRARLAAGLGGLVDADAAVTGEFDDFARTRRDVGSTAWGLDHGFNMAGWVIAQQMLQADPDYRVSLGAYIPLWQAEDGLARTRHEMVAAREWDRSVEYQVVYRTIGVDASLVCFRSVPNADAEAHGLYLTRAAGRPNFTPRQTVIVRETVTAVTRLLGGSLARFTEPSPAGLPPQVLRCLLEGDGDKQAAARLGLRPNTVNQYVKAIFAHFGVATRSELLARWVRRGWGARFAWADG